MTATAAFDPVPSLVAELATRGLDLKAFWRELTEVLTPAVPHYIWPCWWTVDPASLLIKPLQ